MTKTNVSDFNQRVIDTLQRGESLPAEWARELFPPEKREYELVYQNKMRDEDILAETMAVPLQPASSFGKAEGWENKLIFGDNLQSMKSLLALKEQGALVNADGTPGIRLVYIDPPFATKQEFSGSRDQKAYQDKIKGAEFIEFLRRRLILIRELLAPDGVIFVHIDWKKGHYVKAILDEIFGEGRFRNEIIWWYYNKMQGNINRFPSNHETIFFYSAGDKYTFNTLQEERAEGTSKLLKRVWNGATKKLVNAKGPDGKVIYLETDERRVDDVWRLSMLQPADKTENIGYPTQKPETLLAMIVAAASKPGDIVMDCFAGSGTTLAVAEKLGRRWIGIDSGKLAIYTIQKRLLNLKHDIGNTGKPLKPNPFSVFNAGLYDFSTLNKLPWKDWRFFALQLFGCTDEPHVIGGLKLDGKLRGASVLVFDHINHPGQRIDEDTIADIHAAVGKRIGRKFFIVAPRGVFDFQQDFIDVGTVRYYALRIPYSFIHELHNREFMALTQPVGSSEVNAMVDSVGFDFIEPPQVKWSIEPSTGSGKLIHRARLQISSFASGATSKNTKQVHGFDALAMVMLDLDYNGSIFEMGEVFYANELETSGWSAAFDPSQLGESMMVVFLDIYGNEAREMIATSSLPAQLRPSISPPAAAPKKTTSKAAATKKAKKVKK